MGAALLPRRGDGGRAWVQGGPEVHRDDQGGGAAGGAQDRGRGDPDSRRARRIPGLKLSDMWTGLRTLRVADGPDIVHLNTIAKMELARPPTVMGEKTSGINQNIAKYGKFAHVQKAKM